MPPTGTPSTTPAGSALTASGRRRGAPSPGEQARREAWGAKWGPLVGASIRAAIRAHDRDVLTS